MAKRKSRCKDCMELEDDYTEKETVSNLCTKHHRERKIAGFKPIPKKTAKQAEKDRLFAIEKAEHLKNNPLCAMRLVPDCQYWATDVHHGAGKDTIELLLNSEFFVSGCRPCHIYAESHPKEAKAKGLSFDRNK